jgi:group I intron endonuclease
MEKIGYIYKITNPFGKIYIGKTTRLNDRISCYRNNQSPEQRLISRSISKYGWDNHIFEIIDEAPFIELNELEQKYIQEYNSFFPNNKQGMNLTKGGEGTYGRIPTIEHRKKLSESLKGKHHSDKTKQIMSSLKKGKPSHFFNKKHTNETKHKISVANLGRVVDKQTIQNIKNTKLNNLLNKHEAILQINPISNNIIKEWKILPTDIAKELNVDVTNIRKCLNHKNQTSLGYIWKYKR